MKQVFTNYRINKKIDRSGVNTLIKSLKKRTSVTSFAVITSVGNHPQKVQERWILKKHKNGKFKFNCLERKDTSLKTFILNSLVLHKSFVIILICDMNQKLENKKFIKEMWGFKLLLEKGKTTLKEISSEDIYKYSTLSFETGKTIPHRKEIVYCGPDGKICGWDID
jgi:hypothetical protein